MEYLLNPHGQGSNVSRHTTPVAVERVLFTEDGDHSRRVMDN